MIRKSLNFLKSLISNKQFRSRTPSYDGIAGLVIDSLLILKTRHSPAMTPRTRWPLARNDKEGRLLARNDK